MSTFFRKIDLWLGQFFTWLSYSELQLTPVPTSITPEAKPEYRKIESVLTYRERRFLSVLRRANSGEYTILMKVRLADFIWLANDPPNRHFHQSQIMSKHVDFLLCQKVTLEPLLVIELDDSSHDLPEHAARDQFKNEVFEMAGIACLRVPLQDEYHGIVIQQQIIEKIGHHPSPTPGHRWYG